MKTSLKKMLASLGVQPPYPHWPRAFRQIGPFLPATRPILAPKSLFNFSGGVPGSSLAPNLKIARSLGHSFAHKSQICTLPGTPPRSLKAKSKIIKKPQVFPS